VWRDLPTGGPSIHARTCAQASAANEATKSRIITDLCMLALVGAATTQPLQEGRSAAMTDTNRAVCFNSS